MMFYIAFILFLLPSVMPVIESPELYLTMRDCLIVALSYLVYSNCSMREYRRKVSSSVFVIISLYMFFHNLVIDYTDVDIVLAVMSIIFITSVIVTFYMLMLLRFDNLPNDDIKPGNLYEIIGRPRSNLQFTLMIITGGLGGSFAVTNGVNLIKMSKSEGVSVMKPFSESYLIGKKCILIGPDNEHNRRIFRSKKDVQFRLWRNCYWLSKGYKRV